MRALALLVALCLCPLPALALEQPNGAPIPSDMGCDGGEPTGLAAELACVCDTPGQCNIGEPCSGPNDCPPVPGGTCETTLWHSFNDNTCIPSNLSGLDPSTDGALTPETFQPTCPLTFTVVTRGTAKFRDAFGWYNVTDGPPQPDDLHVMLDCDAPVGMSVTLDVMAQPDYAGGEIGFFLVSPEDHGATGACAGGDCCASVDRLSEGEGRVFYSQRAYNPDAAGAESYIHLLILDSRITQRKFYFAWEDIFGGSNNNFTDLVTSVEGVECSGAGQSCDTGMPGACSSGVSACQGDGVECVALWDPVEESCDGADDDCDDSIDEGSVCSDDVVGNCEGVTCPTGQVCRYGSCSDPCKHVACSPGDVCRGGACFPGCNQCNGIVCASDETCDSASGECLGPGEEPPGSDAGIGGGGGDGGGNGGGAGDGTAPAGCGCRAGGDSGAPALLLLLLAAGTLRKRRAPRRW